MRKAFVMALLALSCASRSGQVEKTSARDNTAAADASSDVDQCVDGQEIWGAARLGAEIPPDTCPADSEPVAGKVWHERYLHDHEGATQTVAIVLKEGGIPARCSPAGGCPPSNGWQARQAASEQQVRCVLERTTGGDASGFSGFWYDKPKVEFGRATSSVGRIFRLTLSWDQVWIAAGHPYVARIEPVPGAQHQWQGQAPPPIPCSCPRATEDSSGKLTGFDLNTDPETLLRVTLHLRSQEDIDAQLQDVAAAPFASMAQAIAAERQIFCVQRALDQIITAPRLSTTSAAATLLGTWGLPPFGDLPVVIEAFGIELSRREAVEIAKHPFVARVELVGPSIPTDPVSQCPPDLDGPLAVPDCTDSREDIEAKISSVLLDAHTADCTDQYSVAVSVRGGATYCPLPECPVDPAPCPERDAWESRWQEENILSQKCVRQALYAMGADIETESSFINAFYTHLDWSQIESLAAMPDVETISENELPCGLVIPLP